MKPHLVRWHKEYAEKGLVVIDIDDGTEDTIDELKASVDQGKFKYPVLWDKGAKNIDTYGVRAFPAAYLVGVDGKVIWEGHPLSEIEEIEKLLKAELEKVKKEQDK